MGTRGGGGASARDTSAVTGVGMRGRTNGGRMTAIALPADAGTQLRRAIVRSVVPIVMARAHLATATGQA